jgi:putative SOS response-associated peptidase YedK
VIESCTIIVCDARKERQHIHYRMQVILHTKDYDFWLDRGVRDVPPLKALLVPYPPDELVATPAPSR